VEYSIETLFFSCFLTYATRITWKKKPAVVSHSLYNQEDKCRAGDLNAEWMIYFSLFWVFLQENAI
jgi:hypothetical protein